MAEREGALADEGEGAGAEWNGIGRLTEVGGPADGGGRGGIVIGGGGIVIMLGRTGGGIVIVG